MTTKKLLADIYEAVTEDNKRIEEIDYYSDEFKSGMKYQNDKLVLLLKMFSEEIHKKRDLKGLNINK